MSADPPTPPTRRREGEPIVVGSVARTWWPLAASWLLMGLELPAVSAVMARLPQPTLSLAAYGGVVFPIALMIESPIIMLLAASTALSKDWHSYRLVRRFMLALGGSLSALHLLIAFTPLYDVVVRGLIGVPEEIVEPARTGLRIMAPWTLSIAYRRFQQGVLIRFDRSWAVGAGTAVRLGANALVLMAGYFWGRSPGIVVGTLAVATGVVSEAVFAGLVVRPVVRGPLRSAAPESTPLTFPAFLSFYLPLAVTPLFVFFAMPLTSAAMSRMPRAIESLAVWPVINGLVFTLRSTGFALNEVVVSMLDRPRALSALKRFTLLLAAITSTLLLVTAATPLGGIWFGRVSALAPGLAALGTAGLWIGFAMPALSAYQSLYQGAIVHSRRTRAVTESVMIYTVVIAAVLGVGIAMGRVTGLYFGLLAMTAGNAAQVVWLELRARGTFRELAARDELECAGSAAAAVPGH